MENLLSRISILIVIPCGLLIFFCFASSVFHSPGFSESRFFRVYVFQGPGFSEARFFWVQVFQVPGFLDSGSRVWVQVKVALNGF